MNTLSSRREIFFAYDIRMGNPNGDPFENRPRSLPDGTHYVTDVRLKRFVRDYLAQRGKEILVQSIEHEVTNLTGRVIRHLEQSGEPSATGQALVSILLDAFIDARLFGSSLAFKEHKGKEGKKWKGEPVPKTLTGAVQFNHGEVLHKATEVDIHGTSVFASKEENKQGTFTTFYGLRYGLVGFHGVANEHAAKTSRLSDQDYDELLHALWHSVRSAANTRTKMGQTPRLLLSIDYKPDADYQLGSLLDYVDLVAANGRPEKEWSSFKDYKLDLSRLHTRLTGVAHKIERVRYALHPDVQLVKNIFTTGSDGSHESLGSDVSYVSLGFDH